MNEHRYILEPYKGMRSRYHCPNCQVGDKTFSLYIDTETSEYIHNTVGRCNRESNCGYHFTPKQYFQDNNISFDSTQPTAYKPKRGEPQTKPVSFIPVEVFKGSLTKHENNHFVKFLVDRFGVEVTCCLVSRYFIASSKHWNGATVFWQIDTKGKVRTGKIMLYNPVTGKRVKEPFNYISWVHKAIKQSEFELKQCLFGEHLLIDNTKPVAIVESEKTAVIASIYLPQFIWLAVGSLNNLNIERCNIIKGRTVTLFPDLNGFVKWENKVKELSHLAFFTVSELLENKANETERKQGLDLADYLLKFELKDFTLTQNRQKQSEMLTYANSQNVIPDFAKPLELKKTAKIYKSWLQDLKDLKTFFTESIIKRAKNDGKTSIKLNQWSTITDVAIFIESHFATLERNDGNYIFLPYLNRLLELKQYLTTK